MSKINKSYVLSKENFNKFVKFAGKPIIDKDHSNIYCFWKFNEGRINVYINSKNELFKLLLQGYELEKYELWIENINSTDNNLQLFHCGADEAGKGEDFGPLVICFVLLTKEQQIDFKNNNVRDSKSISNFEINKLARFLLKNLSSDQYTFLTIPCSFINEQRSDNNNLHTVMLGGYKNGIETIINNFPDCNFDIVIDAFVSQTSFEKKINTSLFKNNKIILETKAEDKYMSVACASILARYQYQQMIILLSKNYGYDLPIGANFNLNIKPFIDFLIDKKIDNQEIIKILKDVSKNSLTKTISYIVDKKID